MPEIVRCRSYRFCKLNMHILTTRDGLHMPWMYKFWNVCIVIRLLVCTGSVINTNKNFFHILFFRLRNQWRKPNPPLEANPPPLFFFFYDSNALGAVYGVHGIYSQKMVRLIVYKLKFLFNFFNVFNSTMNVESKYRQYTFFNQRSKFNFSLYLFWPVGWKEKL